MDILVVVAEAKAKPGKADELRSRLQSLLAPTRAEQGCVTYNMHESLEEPGRFLAFEHWKSKEALDEHLQTPHLQDFFGAMNDLVDGGVNIRLFRQFE